jgi:hypothetical protein
MRSVVVGWILFAGSRPRSLPQSMNSSAPGGLRRRRLRLREALRLSPTADVKAALAGVLAARFLWSDSGALDRRRLREESAKESMVDSLGEMPLRTRRLRSRR